jgi:ABC-type sugar transport system permease subunit
MMVYLTGLKALPKDVIDAARVDGAGAWHRLVHVIIPMMKTILVIVVTLDLIESLKTFDIVLATTRGGPGVSTEVLGTRIYKAAFEHWKLGYSCAIATILFLVTMVITTIYLYVLMKEKRY